MTTMRISSNVIIRGRSRSDDYPILTIIMWLSRRWNHVNINMYWWLWQIRSILTSVMWLSCDCRWNHVNINMQWWLWQIRSILTNVMWLSCCQWNQSALMNNNDITTKSIAYTNKGTIEESACLKSEKLTGCTYCLENIHHSLDMLIMRQIKQITSPYSKLSS